MSQLSAIQENPLLNFELRGPSGGTWRTMIPLKEEISLEPLVLKSTVGRLACMTASEVVVSHNGNNHFSSFQHLGDCDLPGAYRKIKEQKAKANFFKLLNDVNSLYIECKEEGYEEFSEKALDTARSILQLLCHKFLDHEYSIYPTEDREIAIDYNPVDKKGILILCDSEGGIAFFAAINGENSRYRCDDYSSFPHHLLWKYFARIDNNHQLDSSTDISTKHNSKYAEGLLEKYKTVELLISSKATA